MVEYFSKWKSLIANVKVKLYLPDYATKADWKNEASVDTSDFGKKTELATFKSDVDKQGSDKLKSIARNLRT